MRPFLLSLAAAALLVAPAAAASSRATVVRGTVLYGTVGPGYTITLKTAAGKTVKTVPHGAVTIHVSDRSLDHDFHLTGAGVDRSTQVNQKGSFTWHVTLKAGRTYTYECDPHQLIMIGHFRAI